MDDSTISNHPVIRFYAYLVIFHNCRSGCRKLNRYLTRVLSKDTLESCRPRSHVGNVNLGFSILSKVKSYT